MFSHYQQELSYHHYVMHCILVLQFYFDVFSEPLIHYLCNFSTLEGDTCYRNWAIMDSNRYYRNQFDDYANSGNLNIVVSDGNMVCLSFTKICYI